MDLRLYTYEKRKYPQQSLLSEVIEMCIHYLNGILVSLRIHKYR